LGRQINFYAGPRDLEALAAELRKKGALIIAERSPKPEPLVARAELPVVDGFVLAWLVREEDLEKLKWWHISAFGYWVLEHILMEEPAVQFHGPTMRGHVMLKGRLWFAAVDGGRQKKPEDFVRSADSLLRVPRKVFSKVPKPEGYSYTVYIGPEAAELVASGQIVLDDVKFNPREYPTKT
jgi:hypothetical protein